MNIHLRSAPYLVVLLLVAWAAMPVAAASVTPVFVPGNPSCTSLGYSNGFKPQPEPPTSNTYPFPSDPANSVTITSDGTFFDWTSTLGIDAVIVKGGPNANVYVYDPPAESFSDTGLHSPINPSNNDPFGLSHIEFCYDYEIEVSKDAQTTFTRTFDWTIDKSVTPAIWDLFTGDSGTSQYTVAVTKDAGTDSGWAVKGTITIHNPHPTLGATITSVTDSVDGIAATVICPGGIPQDLAAGATLICSYNASLPDGEDRTNTATVTTSGAIDGGTGTAAVVFGAPTTKMNDTIMVLDTNKEHWIFGDSGQETYKRTFTCDGDKGKHPNTATIEETGQFSSAGVTVNCYALAVTKDAATSFTRKWTWTIGKSADETDLTLSPGQLFDVNYEVTVSATSEDNEHHVSGNIWVSNPNPSRDASLTAVSDIVSPDIAADVVCPSSTVPAGGSLHCTYSADLPDATDRTNTATATLQNFNYDFEGQGTASGTTDFSGTANVSFSNATTQEIDECIDVSDTNVDPLGTVCAGDAPKTFTYSLGFGQHPDADVQLECGDNSHTNTASFVTNDSGATGQDSETVKAHLACAAGCTLTPGYWKTHSHHGPAPADDAWFNLGAGGADTPFFISGKTYYQVLWTPPTGGNAYYILAHAYIAAKLNILNGASTTPQVDAAITYAESFFATNTPSTTLTKAQRNAAISNAGTLDKYNNGLTGPGHCSEEQEKVGGSNFEVAGYIYLPVINTKE